MFKFKGISSKDMQVVIEEEEHFIARAARRYETTEIEGRDGAIFEELGYSYVERPIYVQCLNTDKIDEILAWLDGEGEFEYKGRKTTARFYSELEPQREGYIRIIDTTFIRDPFWTKLDDEYVEVKGRKDKTTEKSSNINVKDSSDLNAKVDVFGISEQKTRSGINLTNYKEWVGLSTKEQITKKDDDEIICTITDSSYGVRDIERILKPNTNYTACVDSKFSGNLGSQYGLRVNINGSTTSLKADGLVNFTTDETGKAEMRYYVGFPYSGENATLTVSNIRLYEGTYTKENIPEFEQYGASPSPEFPSEIENTGDNINLFNKETVGNNTYIDASNGQVQSYTGSSSSDYINVKNLKSVILSGDTIARDNGGAFYNSEKVYISGFTTTQIWSGIDIPDTANYVRVTATTANLDKIKLEKGKKATSYSSYKCGSIGITVCNKNLFDKNKITDNNYLNENGGLTSNTLYCVSDFINVAENETYFLKTRGTSRTKFYDKNKQPLTNIWDVPDGDKKFVIPSNAKYIRFSINKETVNVDTFQFERNSIATDFIPHKEQLITFPLAEGQKMYEGSETEDDGIHHKRKQIELDGTENWILSGLTTNNQYILTVPDIKIIGENNKGNLISSHFKEITGVEGYNNNNINGISGWGSTQIRISLDISIINRNVAKFKNWLAEQKQAGIPVTIEYPLAEEEIEPYTPEQQEAYNKLQNAQSYYNEINVFTDKALLVFKYIADTTEKIENEGNVYSRPILRLEKTICNEVDIMIEDVRFQYDFNDEEYVEIDCEEKEVKYEGLNRNRKIQIGYEFPKLKVGENKIKMYGGDCIIKAKRKDRWL